MTTHPDVEQWIPVSERLPNRSWWYPVAIIVNGKTDVTVSYWDAQGGRWESNSRVTHLRASISRDGAERGK
jgi:hypothetical protein